jgi:hypothetical protein
MNDQLKIMIFISQILTDIFQYFYERILQPNGVPKAYFSCRIKVFEPGYSSVDGIYSPWSFHQKLKFKRDFKIS